MGGDGHPPHAQSALLASLGNAGAPGPHWIAWCPAVGPAAGGGGSQAAAASPARGRGSAPAIELKDTAPRPPFVCSVEWTCPSGSRWPSASNCHRTPEHLKVTLAAPPAGSGRISFGPCSGSPWPPNRPFSVPGVADFGPRWPGLSVTGQKRASSTRDNTAPLRGRRSESPMALVTEGIHTATSVGVFCSTLAVDHQTGPGLGTFGPKCERMVLAQQQHGSPNL